MKGHFLIVEARFYPDIAEAQLEGAKAALRKAQSTFEVASVPGALEIPIMVAIAEGGKKSFDGYIALGCIIRGETTHYDTVCFESARGIMNLAISRNLAIGNGILTVENLQQASERADLKKKDKGGDAARAAIALAEAKKRFSN